MLVAHARHCRGHTAQASTASTMYACMRALRIEPRNDRLDDTSGVIRMELRPNALHP